MGTLSSWADDRAKVQSTARGTDLTMFAAGVLCWCGGGCRREIMSCKVEHTQSIVVKVVDPEDDTGEEVAPEKKWTVSGTNGFLHVSWQTTVRMGSHMN